jgi:hypothetical protein
MGIYGCIAPPVCQDLKVLLTGSAQPRVILREQQLVAVTKRSGQPAKTVKRKLLIKL